MCYQGARIIFFGEKYNICVGTVGLDGEEVPRWPHCITDNALTPIQNDQASRKRICRSFPRPRTDSISDHWVFGGFPLCVPFAPCPLPSPRFVLEQGSNEDRGRSREMSPFMEYWNDDAFLGPVGLCRILSRTSKVGFD